MDDPLPPLREVIAKHDLGARKALGQHFLLDLNLTRRIARQAGDLSHGTTIEVGPGPGGLTRALLMEGATKVIAIEKDRRCLAALAEISTAFPGRLEVIEADALEIKAATLGNGPRRIVANLPYNVSTQLTINWLQEIASDPTGIEGMILMYQKEVAQRLTAAPRTKDYGRLSILSQWLCEVSTLFDIPPQAFTPPPKVVSSVVGFAPRSEPLAEAEMNLLERVTAAAFGQRRKMLRQSLKGLGHDPKALLTACGIAETARGEELSVEEFCCLARALGTAA